MQVLATMSFAVLADLDEDEETNRKIRGNAQEHTAKPKQESREGMKLAGVADACDLWKASQS